MELKETKKQTEERAILVALITDSISRDRVEEHLEELEMLATTAGANTVFKVVQDRSRIDSAFYIGKGKAEEIAQLVELNEINLVIFDDDLNPTQIRNLEKIINKKILDRSGLILDIFVSHAKTKEAKTQVELAQLQYLLPRLTRAWTHLSKQYGGIGTKGPGETQIETDRRIIRYRISKLKEKLKQIEQQHQTKSQSRKNYINATLVGYTNAGKSTLINLLTDADVLAEDKLFATLDSTTRQYDAGRNKKMLISDTVGFIRKLPAHLVASFKTTLNVVMDADIILHVVDISNDYFEEHMQVVEQTLKELKCERKLLLPVFNKVDALKDKSRIEYILEKYPSSVIVSAVKGINISKLKSKLLRMYEEKFTANEVAIDINESRLIASIYELAEVLSADYDDEKVVIRYRTSSSNNQKIIKMLNSNRGD
jgi:GTP-binding protein HflX